MAKKKVEELDDVEATFEEHQQKVSTLAAAHNMLGWPFSLKEASAKSSDEIDEELERLQPVIDRLTEAEIKLKELENKPATDEPVGRVIIKRTRQTSHSEAVYIRTAEIVNGKEYTKPTIKILFDEDSLFCWDSDVHCNFANHILQKHGGREGVIRLVLKWAQTKAVNNPGQYELITPVQYQALLQHKSFAERAVRLVNMAVKNPENPEFAELLEKMRQLDTELAKGPKLTSHVVPGPVSVG